MASSHPDTVDNTTAPTKTTEDTSPPQNADTHPPRPPPIFCLGAAGTGSASLSAALRILGYPNTHHVTEHGLDPAHIPEWKKLDRACDATFPNLPTYTGKPFTRADWDEIWGPYDVVTDLAPFFAESLIPAYPDAKVILVERDVDRWVAAKEKMYTDMTRPLMVRVITWMAWLQDNPLGTMSLKMFQGWTRAETPAEGVPKMKETYLRHYKMVRESVPEERLLDFQLKDGWAPLCAFLGKEVPKDTPFPHVNDAKAFAEYNQKAGTLAFKLAGERILSGFKKRPE